VSDSHSPNAITWCAIIAVTCLLLFLFQKILWLVVPFVLAFALYYLLAPLNNKLVLSGLRPDFSAALLSGAFLMLAGAALLFIYPVAIEHAGEWQASFLRYLAGGIHAIDGMIGSMQQKFLFLHNSNMGNEARQNLIGFTEHFSDKYLGKVILTIAAWLPSLVLAPVITYFLLKDGMKLRRFIVSSVPNAFFEKTLYLLNALDRTANQYFIGLLKLVCIDAVILSAGLWILGVPSAFILGIVAALIGWIPYIGPLMGLILSIMITTTDFPNDMMLTYFVIGLFVLLRILDDFVFMPYIIGGSMHLHPLLTLLMFFVGEAIAGVAGLMLVIPILAIVMVLGETLEIILQDTRLRARHAHAKKLRKLLVTRDLNTEKV
jgi:predicted PurR-regulated permease PerM